MRIALFTDTYTPTVNGVARTLARAVEHAVARGHEIFLVTPTVSDRPAEHVLHHHQLRSIPAPLYPELQASRGLDRAGRRLLEGFDPDLVHVATEAPVGFSGRRWAAREGKPLTTSFHTDFPAYLAGYGLRGLEGPLWRYLRWFHGAARATLCPSGATQTQLRERGFHPHVRIWSRGVDTSHFDPARRRDEVREALAPGAGRILLYVGRVAPEKRIHLLLESFPAIRAAAGPDVALVVVGDGPAMPGLRAQAVEGVHFVGYRRGVELAEAYAAGDLFIFPSDTETFGNVVLEAMASGLPVIAPEAGGVTECVRPGSTGVLVRPNDADALASAAIRLLEDRRLLASLATRARAFAVSRSWPLILDGLLLAWKQVLEGRWVVDEAERLALLSLSPPAPLTARGPEAAAR